VGRGIPLTHCTRCGEELEYQKTAHGKPACRGTHFIVTSSTFKKPVKEQTGGKRIRAVHKGFRMCKACSIEFWDWLGKEIPYKLET